LLFHAGTRALNSEASPPEGIAKGLPETHGMASLLNPKQSFAAQFWAFALPYGLYVGGMALHPFLGRASAAWVGALAAAAALLFYARKGAYRLGPKLTLGDFVFALTGGFVALLIWVALYRAGVLIMAAHQGQAVLSNSKEAYSVGYLWSRGLASALVIPFAEELFCRVFLLEMAHGYWRSSKSNETKDPLSPSVTVAPESETSRLGQVMDNPPSSLTTPPTWGKASFAITVVFALAHPMAAWPAALVWFSVTQFIYRRTQKLQAVLLAHVLANGAIAWLVASMGWAWLW
jgi:hypothetical protein